MTSAAQGRYRKRPVEIEAHRWQPYDLEQSGYVVGWLMKEAREHWKHAEPVDA